ncbi:MAG: Sigma-54 modulation protein [uncultured bacterium]|nr:MAG: Sigma-54 modulation protein [uncultured bacterium]
MQLNFTGRNNLIVTPALKTYTQEKLQRLERRHTQVQKINIVFHVENVTHIAEATAHIDGAEIHAAAKATDMYVAIDELVDKLIGQVTKYKEKLSAHR